MARKELSGIPISLVQAINIEYFILHKTRNFYPAICKWNLNTKNLKTWINFKKHFPTTHSELRAITSLMDQDAKVNHAKMVWYIVTGLQKSLVGNIPTETPTPF